MKATLNESAWMDIETAPKDGKYFICFNGYEMMILNQPPGCAIGRWHKTRGKWNGAFERLDNPTHWMPLPEAPNAALERTGRNINIKRRLIL